MPDPVFPKPAARFWTTVLVTDLLEGIPLDANVRVPGTKSYIAKDIAASLLNEEGTPNAHHLRSLGITLIAADAKKVSDTRLDLTLVGDYCGIANGGTTYTIAISMIPEILELIAEGQDVRPYVDIFVLSGYPEDVSREISVGRNNQRAVSLLAIADSEGHFNALREHLGADFAQHVRWTQNAEGHLDATDVLVTLDMLNRLEHPIEVGKLRHPTRGTNAKTTFLRSFMQGRTQVLKFLPLARDALVLRDLVSSTARDHYNAACRGKGASLACIQSKAGAGAWQFPFLGEAGKFRLCDGALYPMLSAFRCCVELPSRGKARWIGGFDAVKELWASAAGEMMANARDISKLVKNEMTSLRKDARYWTIMFQTLKGAAGGR